MIDTLANVKTFLGVTGSDDDALLTIILGQVDQAIKTYVGWNIESEVVTNEYHTADGITKTFVLGMGQVDSGETFTATYDTTDYDSDDYVVYYDEGIVVFYSQVAESVKMLKFSYTAGYETADIPKDLQMAFAKMVGGIYFNRKVQSGVSSEKLGDYAVSYIQGGSDIDSVLKSNSSILDAYSRHDF